MGGSGACRLDGAVVSRVVVIGFLRPLKDCMVDVRASACYVNDVCPLEGGGTGGRLRRPGQRGRRAGRAGAAGAVPLRGRAARAGESGPGRRRGRACPATPPSSTWTGWSPTGCSTPSTGGCPGAAARARGDRRSCTGARAARWRSRCPTALRPGRADPGRAPSRTPPATGSRFSRRCSARPRRRAASVPQARATGGAAASGDAAALGGRRRRARRARIRTTRPGRRVVLANCPFHALAREHTALVCGMNLHLITALAAGLDDRLAARLDPADGRCCVVLRHRMSATAWCRGRRAS